MANEITPDFGHVTAVIDHEMPLHIWPMCAYLYPKASTPIVTSKTFPRLEMALDDYSWKLISIKQEQGVLAGETLSVSCGKQIALN